MKNRLILLLACFGILQIGTALAQPGGRNMDPVQRAEAQTQLMTDSLSLSEAQSAKVKEVNLKYAQKSKELFEKNTEGDWEAMRASMMALRAEQDAELKVFLTEEQWANWERIRSKMRGPGGRGGGEGKRAPGENRGKN